MALPLWLDCDIALGAGRGDVDDGYALALLLRAPGARLLGVSTVFGNTQVAQATRCARALLSVLGSPVPLVTGAAAPGQVVPAVVEALCRLPRGAHILALGPLTNIAAALRRHPSLAKDITVYIVGGNLCTWGRWPPYWPFEFNLALDPKATQVVFTAPLQRRLFPLPLCRRLTIGPRRLWALAQGHGRRAALGRYLVRHSLRWLAYAPLRYQALSFPLWDVVPVLAATDLIPMRYEQLRLAPYGRGGLRADPAAPQTARAVAFDALAGWRALREVLVPDWVSK